MIPTAKPPGPNPGNGRRNSLQEPRKPPAGRPGKPLSRAPGKARFPPGKASPQARENRPATSPKRRGQSPRNPLISDLKKATSGGQESPRIPDPRTLLCQPDGGSIQLRGIPKSKPGRLRPRNPERTLPLPPSRPRNSPENPTGTHPRLPAGSSPGNPTALRRPTDKSCQFSAAPQPAATP